jgi:hypothetical protein
LPFCHREGEGFDNDGAPIAPSGGRRSPIISSSGFGLQLTQSLGQILHKLGIGPFHTAGAADQDMVGAGDAGFGKNRTGQFAEAPLHPVADDGVADLFRDGEAEPHGGIVLAARPDEQDEADGRRAQCAIGREEFRAAPKLFDLARN